MSLTFGQTRYQALYKDVQRLIEDTASSAVRKQAFPIYVGIPHTAVTGYGGKVIYFYIDKNNYHFLFFYITFYICIIFSKC